MWVQCSHEDPLAAAEHLQCLPGPSAPDDEWERFMPIRDLPPLPARRCGYYVEPLTGVFVVTLISAMLVGLTVSVMPSGGSGDDALRISRILVWVWAIIAGHCVLYLLFGPNGEIRRSKQTCYPIPDEVARRLRKDESLLGLRNITGADGKSFCVRCFVWRPGTSEGSGHHCDTCQRCVTGFDHHCGVFGRCITNGNMPCFYTMIAMFFAGAVTAGFASSMAAPTRSAGSYDYVPTSSFAPTTTDHVTSAPAQFLM